MMSHSPRRQQGVTLIVGLIMLILITLMVTTAFTLNTSNLKSVGNMQFRNESIAAANKAIEQSIATNFPVGFLTVPAAQTFTYDVNNDGTTDYTIGLTTPACKESTQLPLGAIAGSCSGTRGGALAGCPKANWSTMWDITATVRDAVSGAEVAVNQGVRIEVTDVQKASLCP
jgi:Tfp pilus assembly protein PilX